MNHSMGFFLWYNNNILRKTESKKILKYSRGFAVKTIGFSHRLRSKGKQL